MHVYDSVTHNWGGGERGVDFGEGGGCTEHCYLIGDNRNC